MDELTKEFVAESQDGLERMELCLTELEKRPGDTELVSEIFRAVHTIKGATGFLGFTRLQALAHTGEGLLVALREGRIGRIQILGKNVARCHIQVWGRTACISNKLL